MTEPLSKMEKCAWPRNGGQQLQGTEQDGTGQVSAFDTEGLKGPPNWLGPAQNQLVRCHAEALLLHLTVTSRFPGLSCTAKENSLARRSDRFGRTDFRSSLWEFRFSVTALDDEWLRMWEFVGFKTVVKVLKKTF